jgi:hypothetical protein
LHLPISDHVEDVGLKIRGDGKPPRKAMALLRVEWVKRRRNLHPGAIIANDQRLPFVFFSKGMMTKEAITP